MSGQMMPPAARPAGPIRSRHNSVAGPVVVVVAAEVRVEALAVAVLAVEQVVAGEAEAADESHRAEGHLQDVSPGRDSGPGAQGRDAERGPWRIGGADGPIGVWKKHADERSRLSGSADLRAVLAG